QLQGVQHGAGICRVVHHLRRGIRLQPVLRAPDAARPGRLAGGERRDMQGVLPAQAVHRPRIGRTIWQTLVVAFLLCWALAPVAWMLLTSIKPDAIVSAVPPVWMFEPTASNYLTLFGSADFQRYLVNTLIVATVTSLLATTFGFLSAYSFTRFRYRGS